MLPDTVRPAAPETRAGEFSAQPYRTYFRRRKVLVTGGLGFIGRHLCSELLDLNADVTLVHHSSGHLAHDSHDLTCSRLRMIAGDIRNSQMMEKLVTGQEVIFNLAGKSGAADSNKDPFTDLDVNCRGHLTVLEACRARNPNVTVIFPSSRLVYGKPNYLPVDEKHPVAPESLYAVHKLAVENYLFMFARLYGMKVTVLRISIPYGPIHIKNTVTYGIANRFIRSAMDGENITLFGDGEQRRDFLHVRDLVDVMLRSAWAEKARDQIYNIGSGEGISLHELAERAITATGRGRITRVAWPADYRAVETGDYVSDIAKARCELGWRPGIDIDHGISRTVEFHQQAAANAA